jgi:hypothetical protein
MIKSENREKGIRKSITSQFASLPVNQFLTGEQGNWLTKNGYSANKRAGKYVRP